MLKRIFNNKWFQINLIQKYNKYAELFFQLQYFPVKIFQRIYNHIVNIIFPVIFIIDEEQEEEKNNLFSCKGSPKILRKLEQFFENLIPFKEVGNIRGLSQMHPKYLHICKSERSSDHCEAVIPHELPGYHNYRRDSLCSIYLCTEYFLPSSGFFVDRKWRTVRSRNSQQVLLQSQKRVLRKLFKWCSRPLGTSVWAKHRFL